MAENGSPEYRGLTVKQVAAITALTEGNSREQAAERAGVSERTLYRWLADERFQAALRFALAEITDQLTRRLASYAHAATSTAGRLLMPDRDVPAWVRLQAVKLILDNHFRAQELDLLSKRMGRLEHLLADYDGEDEYGLR